MMAAPTPDQKPKAQSQQQSQANGPATAMVSDDIPAEEKQLEEALEHLKLMHIKCRNLRTTIPRMLGSVATPGTPEEIMAQFTTAVRTAQTEIKDFEELYTNSESQKVLEQARKSREAEPKGIKPWRHKDDPNWDFLDNK